MLGAIATFHCSLSPWPHFLIYILSPWEVALLLFLLPNSANPGMKAIGVGPMSHTLARCPMGSELLSGPLWLI